MTCGGDADLGVERGLDVKRRWRRKDGDGDGDGGGDGDGDGGGGKEKETPFVSISRTHTQLAQVIKELKRTTYRPRMAVIGSRGQARSISHWSPYGRVGVVNADP